MKGNQEWSILTIGGCFYELINEIKYGTKENI